jgi:hypothetical protein
MNYAAILFTALLTGCIDRVEGFTPLEDSGSPPCAMVPYNGTLRSDRFLQHGSEGDFWCSADGTAVQGITPLDPSVDGGVLCTCPTETACAPLIMENGDQAVSCWINRIENFSRSSPEPSRSGETFQ